MQVSEYLRATSVKLFLYARQADLSKTNAGNIVINDKKITNIPVAFLMALSILLHFHSEQYTQL